MASLLHDCNYPSDKKCYCCHQPMLSLLVLLPLSSPFLPFTSHILTSSPYLTRSPSCPPLLTPTRKKYTLIPAYTLNFLPFLPQNLLSSLFFTLFPFLYSYIISYFLTSLFLPIPSLIFPLSFSLSISLSLPSILKSHHSHPPIYSSLSHSPI